MAPTYNANWVVMQLGEFEFLEGVIADIIAFIPRLVAAIVILAIGWIAGRLIGGLISSVANRAQIDRFVMDTPLGGMMGGSERGVSRTFGMLGRWFVYALAILAAANVLAIDVLSTWIQTAVSYLPAFIAGLLVIVLGFVVADFIGDAVMSTRAATQTRYTSWFATGIRIFLYFTAIVIGLDTMGIDVEILFVFARAMAWGLAAALAIGLGIAIGWGAKDYVSQNVDRWAGRAADSTPSPEGGSQSGTGGGPGGQD